MDWFTKLLGFAEGSSDDVRSRLEVQGDRLCSKVNGASYGIGTFEMVPLAALRERVANAHIPSGHPAFRLVQGDVRKMHASPEYAGALFQVASQFNALEMIGPDVTPEAGVTHYETDRTQGPACALSAGAALIYRNYFVPFPDGGRGQTRRRQLDGLGDLGGALADALDIPLPQLWSMRNGYCLCTESGLDRITSYLASLSNGERDRLAGLLRIGLHQDVEVTIASSPGHLVSQAFCSALPVAYSSIAASKWAAFARFVLDAAYEATLLAAALNAQRGRSNVVLLTLLGGGAFGNEHDWICSAIERALDRVNAGSLDVRLVSYGTPSAALRRRFGFTSLSP